MSQPESDRASVVLDARASTATPPDDMLSLEGVRSFVRRIHRGHVERGLTEVAEAFLAVLRDPGTGALQDGVKLCRVLERGSLEAFSRGVRALAARSSAVAVVTVFPAQYALADGFGRVIGCEGTAVCYLVEHADAEIDGRCWSAPLDLATDDIAVGETLTEYDGPLLQVAQELRELMPARDVN